MKNKNLKLANSFLKFCIANPELRFWQALHAWSKIPSIFAGSLIIPRELEDFTKNMKDTFYWENKND